MCVYQSFCADPLHQIEQGIWGKHLWCWLKKTYLSASELGKLDGMYVCKHILCTFTHVLIGLRGFLHFQRYITFQMVYQLSNTLQQMSRAQSFV
jgi:hypothetical protein